MKSNYLYLIVLMPLLLLACGVDNNPTKTAEETFVVIGENGKEKLVTGIRSVEEGYPNCQLSHNLNGKSAAIGKCSCNNFPSTTFENCYFKISDDKTKSTCWGGCYKLKPDQEKKDVKKLDYVGPCRE